MWHGATHIAGRYPDRSATHDFLGYGANLVAGLGFATIKLEFSVSYSDFKYPGQTWGNNSYSSMADLAADAAFAAVFNDPDFTRIWISAFSLAQPVDNLWGGAWTTSIADSIEQEYYDMCMQLLSHAGKQFVVSNWEGDWQLLQSFNPSSAIKRTTLYAYRDFHRRRQRAAARARADSPGSTSTIINNIELNRGLDSGCRIISDVLGNVRPDMVSFSMYEAIEGWQRGLTQAELEDDIVERMTKLVRRTRRKFHGPIVISEFGWPIDNPGFVSGGYDVGQLLQVTLDTADALGIVGGIYWQILDNEEQAPGVPYGFGLYARNGSSNVVGPLTATGTYYQGIL